MAGKDGTSLDVIQFADSGNRTLQLHAAVASTQRSLIRSDEVSLAVSLLSTVAQFPGLLLTSLAHRALQNRGLQISSLSDLNIHSAFTCYAVRFELQQNELWPNLYILILMVIKTFRSFINTWRAWSRPDYTKLTQQQSIS